MTGTDQKLEQIAEEYVNSLVTMNNRPPHRPDVLKALFIAGYTRRNEKAQQEIAELRAENERLTKEFEFFERATNECRVVLRNKTQECEKLRSALQGLLNDTQHADHDCDDKKYCPVEQAREALNLGKV